MTSVKITEKAIVQLAGLPKTIRERMRKLVARLEGWPEISGAKALSGNLAGFYRLRTGDYRMQFHVDKDTVVIVKIGHRSDFYEDEKNGASPRRMTIKGKRVVVLEEAEFERLVRQADEWEPPMPLRDEDGLYPAQQAMAVVQARDIIRARRRLGLSQAELSRLAGIRAETLNRIENAKNKPNVATIEKIDRALRRAARKRGELEH